MRNRFLTGAALFGLLAEMFAALLFGGGRLHAEPAAASKAQAEADFKTLADDFHRQTLPLVKKYCHECHTADDEVNLVRFADLAAVRKDPEAWQKVAEMLHLGEMPPKDAELKPTPAEQEQLTDWIKRYLTTEARAHAGDPGPIVLRRLNNAEYTYTLRDLTGVDSLAPAAEFPVDGAAGEGFTNAGNALAMSPLLLSKYLDAGKAVAQHAILLPDGIRWSVHTTRRDWADEHMADIRAIYERYTSAGGGEKVNLQGIQFATNEGGRLPIDRYITALLDHRDELASGKTTIEAVAAEHKLNAKYLGSLWKMLNGPDDTLLLNRVRASWKAAKPSEPNPVIAEIAQWQKALWKFNTVGQIGRVGGPKAWMEPVTPIVSRQDVRLKMAPVGKDSFVTFSLVTSDAGDGNEQDFAIWRNPRFVVQGRPDLPLRDALAAGHNYLAQRDQVFSTVKQLLAAADEAQAAGAAANIAELAKKHNVAPEALRTWVDYLGIGATGDVKIDGYFTTQVANGSGHDFIRGWGAEATPILVANSSDTLVRIPGEMTPHSVAVHPSPTLRSVVGWRSPVDATMRIDASVTHAHIGCGNGVTWSLELRRGGTRQRFATGIAEDQTERKIPIEKIEIRKGDLVSLAIGPRDGNHSCDLTRVDLKLSTSGEQPQTWSLSQDVSSDVQAGNPHADRLGNKETWHFYTELDKGSSDAVIPEGSLLAKWRTSGSADEKASLADALQKLLLAGPPASDAANTALYGELAALGGPLFPKASAVPAATATDDALAKLIAIFGKHPDGSAVGPNDICVKAPSVIVLQLPKQLVEGYELLATTELHASGYANGSVQMQIVPGRVEEPKGLQTASTSATNAAWNTGANSTSFSAPVIVADQGAPRDRFQSAFDQFREFFPAALAYVKIVPVDEVVTLMLFYREDDQLRRLMLSDEEAAKLDRLWTELRYIAQEPIVMVDVLEQLYQYATQDAPQVVVALEPLKVPYKERSDKFKQTLIENEPAQVNAIIGFAAKAFRRPLTADETQDLQALYAQLRKEELSHEDAVRLLIARVLVSPEFLYRVETPTASAEPTKLSDLELATRLSYFLWSTAPDAQLLSAAAEGKLSNPQGIVQETHRMLADPKTRRLATEFACQWVHIYGFDQLDEKSEQHFPTFNALRSTMHEESIQFFTDLFQHNGSVLNVLDADYTFANEELAKHYGLPGVVGPEWRKVDNVKQFSRGGILAQATTLSTQSGASRTSPILRGNWVSEVLLGEKLPKPPKDVPQLPDDESASTELTVRQLTEKHSSDARCAVCHKRIDAFGFSLEGFDAIGRRRDKDLAGRAIDTKAVTQDGKELDGLEGLRNYLLTTRRDAFLRQFCKKLLGYSLGRAVQLSDEPLIAEMQDKLKANDYHVNAAIETIVTSSQFMKIRGGQQITSN